MVNLTAIGRPVACTKNAGSSPTRPARDTLAGGGDPPRDFDNVSARGQTRRGADFFWGPIQNERLQEQSMHRNRGIDGSAM